MTALLPARKPARPFFSSGPCAKPPGYSPEKLATECLGRSHRAKIGKSRLALCIDLMREVLQLPDTHRIGIVPHLPQHIAEAGDDARLGIRQRSVQIEQNDAHAAFALLNSPPSRASTAR